MPLYDEVIRVKDLFSLKSIRNNTGKNFCLNSYKAPQRCYVTNNNQLQNTTKVLCNFQKFEKLKKLCFQCI